MERGDCDLMPALWQYLPYELILIVMSNLPISSLLKFCAVCKKWRNSILSREFPHHVVEPFIFSFYVGSMGRPAVWNLPPLAAGDKPYFEFPKFKSNSWERYYIDTEYEELHMISVDQGLICFRPSDDCRDSKDVRLIHNPVWNKWRKLHVPEDWSMALQRYWESPRNNLLEGLIVDRETGHYKLVAGVFDKKGLRQTLMYDSETKSWTASTPVSSWKPCDHGRGWRVQGSLSCEGNLYWLLEPYDAQTDRRYLIKTLIKYDVKHETWMAAEENVACQLPFDFHVASQNGSLHLISLNPYLEFLSFPYIDESIIGNLLASPGIFSTLGPEIRTMNAQFRRVISNFGHVPENYYPVKAMGEGDTWYIIYQYNKFEQKNSRNNSARSRLPLHLVSINQSRHSAYCLPRLYPDSLHRLWTFTPSLRAIV